METPEQRNQRREQQNQRQIELRESIAAELLKKYPEVTFNRHQYGIDVIHYVVYVVSYLDDGHRSNKIHVNKRKRDIRNSVFSLDSYFLTEDAAKQAINKHLDAAKQKFDKCLTALNLLKQELDFDVSYSIEGDTYGVTDYPYISFEMGGFEFTFAIDN